MNKLKLIIIISNGESYVERFESNYNAKELSEAILSHKFLYIENPDNITMYNVKNIDYIQIIQE